MQESQGLGLKTNASPEGEMIEMGGELLSSQSVLLGVNAQKLNNIVLSSHGQAAIRLVLRLVGSALLVKFQGGQTYRDDDAGKRTVDSGDSLSIAQQELAVQQTVGPAK